MLLKGFFEFYFSDFDPTITGFCHMNFSEENMDKALSLADKLNVKDVKGLNSTIPDTESIIDIKSQLTLKSFSLGSTFTINQAQTSKEQENMDLETKQSENEEEFIHSLKQLYEVVNKMLYGRIHLGETTQNCILEEMGKVKDFETLKVNSLFISHVVSRFQQCMVNSSNLVDLREMLTCKGKLFCQLVQACRKKGMCHNSFYMDYKMTPELRAVTI